MKKVVLLFLTLTIVGMAFFFFLNHKQSPISPLGGDHPKEKPLLVYTFESLKKTKFPISQIMIDRKSGETSDFLSQIFYFSVPKTPNAITMDKVSGLLNLPKQPGVYPVIIMLRGYVPGEAYKPGIGTQPAAEVFAEHGFITLAPDFLGYGESASPSADPFEDRFQTYTTVLTLISSLATLNDALLASYSGTIKADTSKIGIWGHSNGGHIALSTLAISGLSYPTVLWAPVSKPFPYSILYYTDEYDDQGKFLRKALAQFEEDYDTEQFSLPNYFGWIKAPLQIHQGDKDTEIPVSWSDDLVVALKKNNIEVQYLTYQNADHNLRPSGWSSAVANSITFFNNHFKR